jgi:hypothetical protein
LHACYPEQPGVVLLFTLVIPDETSVATRLPVGPIAVFHCRSPRKLTSHALWPPRHLSCFGDDEVVEKHGGQRGGCAGLVVEIAVRADELGRALRYVVVTPPLVIDDVPDPDVAFGAQACARLASSA